MTTDLNVWEELFEAAESGDSARLEALVEQLNEQDRIHALAHLNAEERGTVLAALTPEHAAELLEQIPDSHAAEAVHELEPEDAAEILDELQSDEQADLIAQLDSEDAEAILDAAESDFADLSQQAGIFEAIVLLQRAFPRSFGNPDAVSLLLHVETSSKSAGDWLDASPTDPGLLLRILAAGMDDHAVLRRLFEEPLAADQFPDAASILWSAERRDAVLPARHFELISSHQWLDPLGDPERFSARAWPDVLASDAD